MGSSELLAVDAAPVTGPADASAGGSWTREAGAHAARPLLALLRAYFHHGPKAGQVAVWDAIASHLWWAERQGTARTWFGATMSVNAADIVGRYLTYFGIWEPSLTNWLCERLQPGDTFVDVGSNVGYFTLLASQLVGPAGRVVAVEPSPINRSVLERNLAAYGVTNVRVVAAAASEEEGELTFYGDRVTGTATLDPEWARRHSLRPVGAVRVAPLPQLLTPEERDAVSVIKIDVEGNELPVLRSAVPLLERAMPDVVTEVMTADLHEALGLMSGAGYAPREIPNDYSAAAYVARRTAAPRDLPEALSGIAQIDVLFTRARPPA